MERLRGSDVDGAGGGIGGYRGEDFKIESLFGVRYVPLVHSTIPSSSSPSPSPSSMSV